MPSIQTTCSVSCGELQISELTIRRSETSAQTAPLAARHAAFHLHLQLEGTCVLRQLGREAALGPGDFSLCDDRRQWELEACQTGRALHLALPESVLRRFLARPELIVAVPMSASNGVALLLSQLLRNFWLEFRDSAADPAAARVVNVILGMLATAFAAVPQLHSDRSSVVTAHRARIIDWIEMHLFDPQLAPRQIAEACGMTQRYLHYLFSGQGETVTRYILRRRLEACTRALESPAQRGRTLCAIALSHGFVSATHFGRVFRLRYGITPRAFRRAAAGAAAPVERAVRRRYPLTHEEEAPVA